MTRIVFLTHSAAPAGAELALLNELRARADGTDVIVMFGEQGPVIERFAAAGIACAVVPLGARLASARRGGALPTRIGQAALLVAHTRRLRRELRAQKPDIVVGRSLKAAIYGRVSTVGLGVPFVWCLHDRLTPEYLGRGYAIWSRGVSRTVDALIVNSRSTLATVQTYGKPVLLLPPAIAPAGRAPVRVHSELRLLCLARLAPWKGQDIAIRAFAAVFRGTDATMRIVGGALFDEDGYALALSSLVEELGVGAQVSFVGHLDEPDVEIAACDVLVHSSRLPEPFGLVVLEGMQAGRVVIATAPGGPAEVITHGTNGLLADLDSVGSLTAMMRRVSAMSPLERVSMGDAARATAEGYDATALCAQHLEWLGALARGVSVPALTVAGPS